MTNPNTSFLITLLADLLVGSIVRSAGDATAQAAKAQEVINAGTAITAINNGDVTNGLAALDSALAPTAATDPAKAAAIQLTIAWIASKAAALQQLGGGTLLGAVQTDIVNQVVGAVTTVAKMYLPK